MANGMMLEQVDDAARFIFGDNATFTLQATDGPERFTFKVQVPKVQDPARPVHFVKLMTGSDNEASFSYLGAIFGLGAAASFRTTAKSCAGESAPSVRMFRYVFQALVAGSLPQDVEFWHEGRCCMCGRKLTVPESIAAGIGPECSGRGTTPRPRGRKAAAPASVLVPAPAPRPEPIQTPALQTEDTRTARLVLRTAACITELSPADLAFLCEKMNRESFTQVMLAESMGLLAEGLAVQPLGAAPASRPSNWADMDWDARAKWNVANGFCPAGCCGPAC